MVERAGHAVKYDLLHRLFRQRCQERRCLARSASQACEKTAPVAVVAVGGHRIIGDAMAVVIEPEPLAGGASSGIADAELIVDPRQPRDAGERHTTGRDRLDIELADLIEPA